MKMKEKVVRPGGLELPTFWFVARRSIQLSYGRAARCLPSAAYRSFFFDFNLESLCIRDLKRYFGASHPNDSKWLSKNCLHVQASRAAAKRSLHLMADSRRPAPRGYLYI